MAEDYTEAFNTPLSDEEMMVYSQEFKDRQGDLYDYDLQGWFKQNKDNVDAIIGDDKEVHLTDEFKKPNHPTFSDESMYHGITEGDLPTPGQKKTEGGHWEVLENNKFAFTPGRTNFEHHSTQEIIDYFKKNEPNSYLVLPGY